MSKQLIGGMAIALWMAMHSLAVAQEAAPTAAASGDVYADIPLTRVSMVVPEGFTLVPGFPGVTRADRGASIVITEVPGPFSEVMDSFTQGVGTDRSMRMVKSEQVQVNGVEGTLMVIARTDQGTVFHNWLLLFGQGPSTVMVAATVPEKAEAELAPSLRASMVGVKWDPTKTIDPFSGLSFKLNLDDAFEIRGRRPGGVLLARKEAEEALTPDEPIVLIFPSDATVVAPIETFAKAELTANSQFTEITNMMERATKVGEFNAYEITAEAKEASQQVPVRIYLMVVRTAKNDMVIEGFVSPEKWEQYLPAFRSMATSYTETPVPDHH